jgi:hypothetical protein
MVFLAEPRARVNISVPSIYGGGGGLAIENFLFAKAVSSMSPKFLLLS